MSFTAEYPVHVNNLQNVFKPRTVTIVWETQADIEDDQWYFNKLIERNNATYITIITANTPFIPFLSAEDNVLLGIQKDRKEARSQLCQFLDWLNLDKRILTDVPEQLSDLLSVELQLIRCLLTDQKLIVIDSVLDNLPVTQVQMLLTLIRRIANESHLGVLILTTNHQIAKSSYGDTLISLENQALSYHRKANEE